MLTLVPPVDKSGMSTTTSCIKDFDLATLHICHGSRRQKKLIVTYVCRVHGNEVMHLFVAM